MRLDKLILLELDKVVRKAIKEEIMEAMEGYKEEWVTDTGLSKVMPSFSKGWLRAHGDKLPRVRLKLADEATGRKTRGSKWMYPLHKINRLVTTGELNQVINN